MIDQTYSIRNKTANFDKILIIYLSFGQVLLILNNI